MDNLKLVLEYLKNENNFIENHYLITMGYSDNITYKLCLNSSHCSVSISLIPLDHQYRNYWLPTKYRKSNKIFFCEFKNKIYELDSTGVDINGISIEVPILPKEIEEYHYKKVKDKETKLKDKEIKKFENELDISALAGIITLEGVDNEMTIKDNSLFIHNFGNIYLRIRKEKDYYSISASTNNYTNNYNNGYVIIGYYDKQTVIEKVKGLKGLFL